MIARSVTVVLAYYENPGMLKRQLAAFRALPKDLKKRLALIVVDDGSPLAPAAAEPIGMPLEVWRIEVDVRWNQDAARNLGAHHAASDWLLLTDMDHLVPEDTLRRVVFEPGIEPRRVYRFGRVSEPARLPYKPHPNSWLMTRDMFWSIGGYDEALAGYYGTDADFGRRVRAAAEVIDLAEVLVRVPRDVTPDASTTTYKRKEEFDQPSIKAIVRQRGPGWRPKVLSFPHRLVLRSLPARGE